MPDDTNLLAMSGNGQFGNLAPQLGGSSLPPSLQILLNDGLYERVKQLSVLMSKGVGFTPRHLLGKGEACFAVINIALDAKLNPYFVARHTYQTPGGSIGYDGVLVQALLEASGKFVGSPQFEYIGDWSRVTGKFEKRESQKANRDGEPREYYVKTWTSKDAQGLGIIVRWLVKGESKPRAWPEEGDPFLLNQVSTMNSPLWATDPKTQIAYLAIRRFANIAAPGILGAASFDEGQLIDASDRAVDVTPQREPRREDFRQAEPQNEPEPEPQYEVVDLDGVVHAFSNDATAVAALRRVLNEASRQNLDRLDGAWEDNEGMIGAVDLNLRVELAQEYTDLREHVIETERLSANAVASAVGTASNGSEGDTEGEIPSPLDQTSQPLPPAPAAAERSGLEQAVDSSPPPLARSEPVEKSGRSPVDGERQSQFIQPPLKRGGANSQPDWRTWAVALFMPKLRRQDDPAGLAWFLGDNEENLESCRHGGLGRDDLAGLESEIKAAWERCR